MLNSLKVDAPVKISFLYFVIITIWWLVLQSSGVKESSENYLFGASYGLICLLSGFWGLLVVAPKWGGYKSLMGKAIIVLSLGLLTQEFGQLVFSYYNIFLKEPVPYPSLADIGFFGTIPFYIYGIWLITRLVGVKFSSKKIVSQLFAFTLPVVMLIMTYAVFLRDYEFDFSEPLKIFLDFGYPMGEAIYISIAILAYGFSRNILGGIMRNKILILISAFVMQYIAEFNFLWQNLHGTWLNGGYGDYLYFLAYFTMSIGILNLKVAADQLSKE